MCMQLCMQAHFTGYIEEFMEETTQCCTVGEKWDSSNAPETPNKA